MPDSGDLAADREAADREAALAAFRSRPRASGESARDCFSCGEPIPEPRRKSIPGTNICGFCARQLTRGR